MRDMCRRWIRVFLVLMIFSSAGLATVERAIAQGFAPAFDDDFVSAFREAEKIGQQELDNKLARRGLESLVWQFHRARTRYQPMGYEDKSWFESKFRPMFAAFAERFRTVDLKLAVDEARLSRMNAAYDKNVEAFRGFYAQLDHPTIRDFTREELLRYLAVFSSALDAVDPEGWDFAASFTGIWPFCD